MWGLLFSPGSVWRIAGGGSANDPLAGIIVSVAAVEPVTNPPDLAFTFTEDIAEGDVIECGINAQQVDFSSDPLTAGEIVSGTFDLITSTIAAGSTVAYCRINRSGSRGPWVASVEFEVPATGDSTAPVLSSATATKTGSTTASLSVSTDEGNGTLYWVVTTSSTGPSAAQVKAGNDHTGSAAADSGSQAVSGTGVQNVSGGATGLAVGTTYYAHYMHEDAATNQSTVASSASFTTDWTPTALSANLWVEPAAGGLFQSNAGSTAANANSDVVGYAPDLSGSAFHLTSAADDTTRPTLQGVGTYPYLSFDGSNDVLLRAASLGSYAAGAATFAVVMRGNPAVDRRLIASGSSAGGNPFYCPIQADANIATTASCGIRNDAATSILSSTTDIKTGVFDNTDHVYIVTDDGSNITPYLDGVAGTPVGYTRSGSLTLDRFALGALVRNTTGSWWAGRVYGVVIVNRVITSGERASLTTYLGNLAGLSL